ncbi:MAG: aminotransferase class I/II-fold pyridoxal phosphate-dependent enzyme [Gemmatimonadales bacterium]|nr:aminotransferase class I/II-fold pyridoxal phosphate-dependent enzyme [Gemmatimonadales bacterium]
MLTAPISSRVDAVEPFHAVVLNQRALALEAAGRSIRKLSIGEPDFPTPDLVVRAAFDAALRGETHYTAPLGIPALRTALAERYGRVDGLEVDPARIAVTTGASAALLAALAVLADSGDGFLMADPGYPSNRAFLQMVGAVPELVPVGAAERWQLTPELVDAHWTPRTRGVIVASPGNPTGTVIPDDALRGILDVVRVRGGTLVVDEIYGGLVYGERPRTALGLGDDVVVVNSFSKYHCMTGWRIGWMVAPPPILAAAERLCQHLFISPPTPAQYAALAALGPEATAIFEARRAEFMRRRDYLVPALVGAGFGVPVRPDGAFYVYADCSAFGASEAFAAALLEEAGVAVTPGRDFGVQQADRHVRIAYTCPLDDLADAVTRIRAFAARAA